MKMVPENCAVLLFSVCFVATLVVAQRTPPPRVEKPPKLDLVDNTPGLAPLFRSSDPSVRRNGSFIIKLKKTTEFDDYSTLLGKLNDQNKNATSGAVPVQGLSGYSTVGLGVMAELNDDALKMVREDQSVDFVEEDQIVGITAEPWHRDRVDQRRLPFNNKAYCPPNDGENVDIYILDTGINYCHKDFCKNRARYAGYSPIIAARNSRGADSNGHGTHAAALAVGGIHGIARKARVYSLPVLTCLVPSSYKNIILALNHVVMRANSEPDRRVIVSMSLIGPPSLCVNDAIKTVTQEGIVVITAAGNCLTDACRYTPSSSPDAITVGGTARNDLLYATTFAGSNWGRCVDIFAPGQDITSADFRGCTAETECKEMCDRESVMSGTSMATPIVAGAVALLLSADMSLTPVEVKQKLIDQSTKDKIDMRDITPSSRSITPNKLVYVGKKRRCPPMPCPPSPPPLCGRPWDHPPTVLYPAVRQSRLTRIIRNQASSNLVPSYISPYVKGDETHFAIIYKQVDNVKDYQVVFDIDTATAESTVKDMAAKKIYVVCATSYYVGDTLYHIIVFSKMRGGADVQVYFEQNGRRNSRSNSSAYSDGLSLAYRTITIDAKGRRRFTTLYRRNNDIQTVEFDDLGFRGLRRMVNQQKKNGFQLVHISSFTVKSRTRYSTIFTNEKIGDCEYVFFHSYQEKDIGDIADSLKQDGFRMTAVAVHSQSSVPLFMAVFRK
ncbi:uncharacterized protein [Dysidea avara]|uniref:uncharacterized protein n=1 Tax=Dysidea avara TaxID=196820 RepID=UPI003319BC52